MYPWDSLNNMLVINKFDKVLANWFGVLTVIVDNNGKIKNLEHYRVRKPKTSYADHLLNYPAGFKAWDKMAEHVHTQFPRGEDYFSGEDQFGGRFLAVNIKMDNEIIGKVIAYGFLTEFNVEKERNKIVSNLNKEGFSAMDVQNSTTALKVIKADEFNYFKEMISLVAEEITTLFTEITKRENQIIELNSQLGNRYNYDLMVGQSKAMQDLYAILDRLKSSESTILIQGENGTGKELIARAIHYNSPRKDKTFVTQNCAALNDNLLESELFGHVKGAFTGAHKDKKGLFEIADNGTFFLDEIGDTSPVMQVKLLRVLQEGTFTPVGATEPKKVNIRVLTATNRNLKKMVEEGTFREDLYYRINVINIKVPPLRERKEDIEVLIKHFLEAGCKEKNVPVKKLTKRALEKMYDFNWPGNVRELQNEVERLIVLSGDEMNIGPELLSPRIIEHGDRGGGVQGVRLTGKLKDALEELEKRMILEGLKRTGWNKSRLAKELGISRAGLIMKVEKYGLDKRKLAR